MNFRKNFLGVVLVIVALTVSARNLPMLHNLPEQAALALRQGQLLVLLALSESCNYCEIVKENDLHGLAHNHAGQRLMFDREHPLLHSRQQTSTSARWALDRGIKISQTLLYLGANSNELAPRLLGTTSVDFYGAYVEQWLQIAAQGDGNQT